MNRKQQNLHTMHDVVDKFFDANADKIGMIPVLATKVSGIKTTHLAIKQTDKDREALNDGTTGGKRSARKALVEKASEVCGIILVFARDGGNDELAGSVNFTKTDIRYLSDTELESVSKVILDKLNENLPLLAGYGLKLSDADELSEKIDLYKLKKTSPRTKTANRVQLTKQLKDLFKVMTGLLLEADKLMKMFRTMDKPLYDLYLASRVIVDLKPRSAATVTAPKTASTAKKTVKPSSGETGTVEKTATGPTSGELEKSTTEGTAESAREEKTVPPAPASTSDATTPGDSSEPTA